MLSDFESHRIEPRNPTHQAINSPSAIRLVLDAPLKGNIRGGEVHHYDFPLLEGQYAAVRVEQQGCVLIAYLLDEKGRQVIVLDSPAGGYGPIYLSIIAATSGTYRLEIESTNKWAIPSNYELQLTTVRAGTAQDHETFNAQLKFSEGRKSFRANQLAEAIDSYLQVLPYWQQTSNGHWLSLTLYALSEAYRSSGNRKESEEYLNKALEVVNTEILPNDWRIKASALNDLGSIYATSGQPEKAVEILNQALALYGSHDDRRGQASALNNLAQSYVRLGDLSRGRELIERALAFRQKENDQPGISNAVSALAWFADKLGEPYQALDYLTQSLTALNSLDVKRPADYRSIASLLTSIGTTNDKLGKWDLALNYYQKAIVEYPEPDFVRAAAFDSQGELYAALGDPIKARSCYDEAFRILAAAGKPDLDIKAGLLVHIGQLSLYDGDLDTAIQRFEEARALPPSASKLTDVLTNLAGALTLKGSVDKAMEIYRITLDDQRKNRDRRGQALTLQKRGQAYVKFGKLTEASSDLHAALDLWKAIKDQRGEASTFNDLSRLERGRGNLTEALANNSGAIRVVESLRTSVSSRQLRASYFATQEDYYELNVDLKMQLSKSGKQAEYLASALEANEKARARVLLDALNEAGVGRSAVSESSDPRFSSLIEQRLKLLSTLAAKAQVRTRFLSGPHSPDQIAALDKDLANLSAKYDELDTQLRSQHPKFASLTKSQPATLQQIQAQLDDDSLLIEYSLGETRSYVWVVSTHSIDGFELPGRAGIEGLAKRVAVALTERGRTVKKEEAANRLARIRRAESDLAEASSLLTKAILNPIASLIGQKRLVIVADGALQALPFAVLPQPTSATTASSVSSRPLIEDHEIISLPSASILVLQRRELAGRKPARHAVAVIADPVFDENDSRVISKNQRIATTRSTPNGNSLRLTRALSDIGLGTGEIGRLSFSRQEAEAILKTVPPSESFSALDFKANRTTVMSPALGQYRIIHFATHGVLDLNHPELSGVLLSMVDENGQNQNGYLGLNEIYNLNLPAELAVLSACETGIGKEIKGEGLITLTRGFMYAGAARVVASLWKVNDVATAQLMAEFYKQMLTDKLAPAAALRAAQLKLAHDKRWRNPHFWAGFVLQGEWR